MKTAYIDHSLTHAGYLEVKFNFTFGRSSGLYEDIMSLPIYARRWKNATRAWLIEEGVSNDFRRILNDNGIFTAWVWVYRQEGHQQESRREEPKQEANPVSAYAKLFVTGNAPEEVIRASYRALSMKNHPDKGGDAEVMKTINIAFEQIKTLKGWS
jgi:hypothetical protein